VLGARLEGARVLDLYAGSGSLGLEALSRGAASAVLVERGRQAADAIRRNVAELGLSERAEVVSRDVFGAIERLRARLERFDVVFADPPYRSGDADKLLGRLGEEELVEAGGLVVLEHHHKRELRERYGSLSRLRVLKAGESTLTIYRRDDEAFESTKGGEG
jgi:16S rRNA (guanine(966)-N(2))-methyltransferase RsmD